jgi:hypothetical protein
MLRKLNPRRSPTLVIAIVALIAALAGTAVASGGLNGQQKKQVKKISKKQAKKFFNSNIGGATVANAGHATTADTATKATTANPAAFGHLTYSGSGTSVIVDNAFNITASNADSPSSGAYCLSGLGFTPHAALANVDSGDGPGVAETSVIPSHFIDCPTSAQVEIVTFTSDSVSFTDFGSGFYVVLY